MTVEPGTQLLHYRLIEKIGEGGMGVVWKAADTTLDREVAIKILPPDFQQDPDRPARFQREAKLLAQLNHPHIASIYGLHEAGEIRFIAMELVPGQDLAERLHRGALPLEEALDVAHQVAEALETAHEQGVIHRDLKPANVKLTDENRVKVLDFGLAKAFESEPGAVDARASLSPTLTSAGTRAGVLLGTAAYMSPEQARGQAVDKRADIWAFGALLYELLTGRQAFPGETISDSLAGVLKLEPDYALLPAETPESIRRLLHRSLEKRPKQRLRDIGEARIRVEEALGRAEPAPSISGASITSMPSIPAAAGEPAPAAAPAARGARLPWLLCGMALVVAAASFLWPRGSEPAPQPVVRVEMVMTENTLRGVPGSSVVISPDGKRMAYLDSSDQRIYVRLADQLEATPLSGTEGAWQPFFSPDGDWIGFFADRKLKKVSILGGAPLTLCDAADRRGASWGDDGTIVFAPDTRSGLYRVTETGGEPEPLTTLDPEQGEWSHRWPHMLPGGQAVLFVSHSQGASWDEASIELLDLRTMERKLLQEGGSYPAYVPTGHLVYVHDRTLFAVPFDAESLEVVGLPAPVLEEVYWSRTNGGAHYSVSAAGHLLYRVGRPASQEQTLSWIDREGNRTPAVTEPRGYGGFRLSPDGSRLLATLAEDAGDEDLWIYDFARETMSKLTFSEDEDRSGFWLPDGENVVFTSNRDSTVFNLYRKRADGTGDAERLSTSSQGSGSGDVSPDGQLLVFAQNNPSTGWDLRLLPLSGEGEVRDFLASPSTEGRPRVSPDGRWLCYISDESGGWELYVRPFPEGTGKWQISTSGAAGVGQWSPDGRQIYYRVGGKQELMVVDVSTEGSRFLPGKPRLLFEGALGGTPWGLNWDVHPDGRRFLVTDPRTDVDAVQDGHAMLVVNWFDELRQRAPLKS